ncbi:alpha/beta-hydrolase [Hypoxylon trugodes]|uniref:alpha/beta-hydrolase n=1 Tax=Hypoxylon trugodes TaxID=326681 RepID=UPI00219FC1FA|nr:alpha/beta-hydrolase [Hypoxylon trugodes]KAI1384589.1 alpha/beta-hydrolase [Hypoxylon trugodes]
MPKPTIVLVTGSFAPPGFYDNILEIITQRGYEIKALQLTTVAPKAGPRKGPAATMYDDAALIAKEIEALADEGKDVILLSHSYGGIPASQSTKGLTKKERQEQGKKGGVVRFLYKTALVPALGKSSTDLLSQQPQSNHIDFGVDENGYLYYVDPSAVADSVFSDIPDRAERIVCVNKFEVHSAVSFTNELTHAGYKDAPVSYLLCEEDETILPKFQRLGIDTIERESGNKVDVTSIKAGHCPTVTKPQEVVDWILRETARHEDI